MNIRIFCVGKLKEKYWVDAINEYSKRISKYSKLEIIEVSDEPTKDGLNKENEEKIKDIECGKILAKLKPNDFVCTLDLNKKEFTSEEFSSELISMLEKGGSTLNFVIGGSLGLSKKMKERANQSICFSKLTFPHQLIRVILLEQIYRGFKIFKGEPYHK